MGGKDAVLPERLAKNHTVVCLTYEENTRDPYIGMLCLFTAFALPLHGNAKDTCVRDTCGWKPEHDHTLATEKWLS